MGGVIGVESVVGEGSTFTFTALLPETEAELAAEETPSEPPHPWLRGRICVLAEDNEVNRNVATTVLRKAGCIVHTAVDGIEAIERVNEIDPDFVLMDVQMPRCDGLTATSKIRATQEARARRLPVIGLTAHVLETERERFLAAGMDAVCNKPIRMADIHRALDGLMSDVPPGSDLPIESDAPPPSVPAELFDFEELADILGDADRARDIITKAHRTTAQMFREARDEDDPAVIARTSHELKGIFLTIRAPEAAKALAAAERRAKTGDVEGAHLALDEAEPTVRRLQEELSRHFDN